MTNDGEYRWEIQDLLHRRTDLSTFVIHWTRQKEDGKAARENLESILRQRTIFARTPRGAAVETIKTLRNENRLDENAVADALDSQKVVCFTEAPLEQAWSFVCSIAGRDYQLEPYGLAFTKMKAREMGVNPVWYVDMTPSGHDWLSNYVNRLVKRALDEATHERSFADDPMAKIAPFVDWMGTWPKTGKKKEFWWEREWRHLGDLKFDLDDVAVVLCPASDKEGLATVTESQGGRRVPVIDPVWGLERIIAELAGVSAP
jgi:hypothetical protein